MPKLPLHLPQPPPQRPRQLPPLPPVELPGLDQRVLEQDELCQKLQPLRLQPLAQPLRHLDRPRAHQRRPPQALHLQDLRRDPVILRLLGLVDHVGVVGADHRPMRRDHRHRHPIDLDELRLLRLRRPRHPRQLLVEPEEVLVRDRRGRHVLALDLHLLLRLDGLVQPLGVPPAVHQPPRELVHDDDLAVPHHVVHIPLVAPMGAQRRIHVLEQLQVLRVRQVRDPELPLQLPDPVLRQRRRLRLLIDDVVRVPGQPRDHAIDPSIQLGRLRPGAGEDQRRARLVDEHAVRLVHDRVVQAPQDQPVGVIDRVIAQVIEPHLRVRRIRDVTPIGLLPLLVIQIVLDHPHRQPQRLVDRRHPVPVSLRQVVVVGQQVRALALQRVQVQRQHRDLGLPLTRPHLGDAAPVQHDRPHHLHIEVGHELLPLVPHVLLLEAHLVLIGLAQRQDHIFRHGQPLSKHAKTDLFSSQLPPGHLAHERVGLDQEIVERLPPRQPVAELLRLGPHLLIGELLHLRAKRVDPADDAARPRQLSPRRIEDEREYRHRSPESRKPPPRPSIVIIPRPPHPVRSAARCLGDDRRPHRAVKQDALPPAPNFLSR